MQCVAEDAAEYGIEAEKDEQHLPGEVYLPDDVQYQNKENQSDAVGFKNTGKFFPPAAQSFLRIQVHDVVKYQINRYNKEQSVQIVSGGKYGAVLFDQSARNPDIPCQPVGKGNDDTVQDYMQLIQLSLVVFYHK